MLKSAKRLNFVLQNWFNWFVAFEAHFAVVINAMIGQWRHKSGRWKRDRIQWIGGWKKRPLFCWCIGLWSIVYGRGMPIAVQKKNKTNYLSDFWPPDFRWAKQSDCQATITFSGNILLPLRPFSLFLSLVRRTQRLIRHPFSV